jgi:hypothetical protein
MAAVVVTLPESRPEDDEDVVWGLSTAAALWARGERADAVVWLRRAAEAAAAAGQEARAGELQMFTVRVEQALEQLTQQDEGASPPVPELPALDRVSLGFEEVEPEPVSAPPQRAAPVPPPVPVTPVPAVPVPTVQAAVVPRAAVAAMRPKSIRPPAAPVAAPRSASVAPPPSSATPPVPALAPPVPSKVAVFHTPPAAPSVAPPPPSTSAVFHAPPVAPLPSTPPAATSAPVPAAPPNAVRPPSTPPGPPSRAPESSSYPSARKATGPRVPILDPWADEPTMPNLRVDPVLHTLQVEGDEVMVQMRRGAARVVEEEEDGVITSAAPLDHTLRRTRMVTPPARRLTATGEQPPGHIADASTGVPPKVPVAPKPHLPPKLPEKAVADGAAAHPLADTMSEAGSKAPPKVSPPPAAAIEISQPHPVPPVADVAPPGPAVGASAVRATPVPAAPTAATTPSGPPLAATVPSFRLVPAAGAAASPLKPKVPTPTLSPPREAPRSPTLRSLPSTPMPRPRPVTIPPPAAATSAPASASPAPAPDGLAKSGAALRFPLPPSRPPPPSVVAPLAHAAPAAAAQIPKPAATPPPAASLRTPPQRLAVPPPPPSAPQPPPARETSQVQPAPRVPSASRTSAPPAPPAPSLRAFDASALEGVEALADVPPETRAILASRARVDLLGADDEVSVFGAALVIEGGASVSATIVDAPVAHASPGTLVPTRGTLADGVALRVVAGAAGARVALWDQSALDAALGSCPWVLEELAARADRLQALAGATMGPLGELDEATRDGVLDKLVVCVLRAGEAVDAEGIAAALVGAGSVELVEAGKTVVVRAGEVLFPRASAPEDAKAGVHGTILLVGDAAFTTDLDAGRPSLPALFAPR